ncbi:LOW QUALITY PROTEIN: hypothetical protein ACHAWF_016952, partial [Thalassiosira exigua]
MWMARSFMLHASLDWTEQGIVDIALYAVWIYNHLPNQTTGMTPMEFTKNKADHRNLLRTHRLNIRPQFKAPRQCKDYQVQSYGAQQAQFLGFSDQHSFLVALIRQLGTGFVSPQQHVVFDNKFETVYSTGVDDEVVDAICKDLFENSRDWYVEPEYNKDG